MDASLLTTDMNVAKTRYKKVAAQVTYTAASWKYISKCFVDPALGIWRFKIAYTFFAVNAIA